MNPIRAWGAAVVFALAACPASLAASETIDRVVAKINDDIVMASDLDAAVRRSLRRGGPGSLTPKVVEDVFDRLLLLQVAKRQKADASDEEAAQRVESALAEARTRYPSESAFLEDLRRAGMSLEQFKAELTKDYKADERLYRAVASRFTVTDADVAAFEESERAAGRMVGEVQLRRLAVRVEGEGAAARQKAKDRASGLLQKINAERLPFPKAVAKYSEFPNAKEDEGDLGFIELSRLSEDLRNAVSGLKPGEVTPPLVTGEFVSVFYVESRQDARGALFQKRFIEERERILEDMRGGAVLAVYDEKLRSRIPETYAKALGRGTQGGAPQPAAPPQ